MYVVPSRSSAKRIPANRRASATTATFLPRRAAIRAAHARSSTVDGSGRRSVDTAACTSSRRMREDPALVMGYIRSPVDSVDYDLGMLNGVMDAFLVGLFNQKV